MTGHRDRAEAKAKELRSEVRYCALPSVSMARREGGGGGGGHTGFGIVFHCVDVVGGERLWDASWTCLRRCCCQLFLVGLIRFGSAGS